MKAPLAIYPWGVYYFGCMQTHKHGAPSARVVRRLKIIEGQVRGLQDLVTRGAYCVDVITQTSAVKQALAGIEDVLLEEHLSSCVVQQIKTGAEQKAVTEILKVYRLKRK